MLGMPMYFTEKEKKLHKSMCTLLEKKPQLDPLVKALNEALDFFIAFSPDELQVGISLERMSLTPSPGGKVADPQHEFYTGLLFKIADAEKTCAEIFQTLFQIKKSFSKNRI